MFRFKGLDDAIDVVVEGGRERERPHLEFNVLRRSKGERGEGQKGEQGTFHGPPLRPLEAQAA